MKTVAVIGGVSIDHIVIAPTDVRFHQPGGPGLYASLAGASIAGVAAHLITDLPAEDEFSLRAITQKAEINTSNCRLVDDIEQCWILDAPEGRRIVPVRVEAGESEVYASSLGTDVAEPPYIPELQQVYDAVLLCAPQTVNGLDSLLNSPIRGIDPDQLSIRSRKWHYIEACCRWATVLLPSRVQLLQLGKDPLEVANQIRTQFAIDVIAKLDRDGAVVMPSTGGMWQIQDRGATVVDTTGAGDTLAGATLAALARGENLVQAAAIGVSAARLTLADWSILGLIGYVPSGLVQPFNEIHIADSVIISRS